MTEDQKRREEESMAFFKRIQAELDAVHAEAKAEDGSTIKLEKMEPKPPQQDWLGKAEDKQDKGDKISLGEGPDNIPQDAGLFKVTRTSADGQMKGEAIYDPQNNRTTVDFNNDESIKAGVEISKAAGYKTATLHLP